MPKTKFGHGYEPAIASSAPARAEAFACSVKLPGQEVAEGKTPYSRGQKLVGEIGLGSGDRHAEDAGAKRRIGILRDLIHVKSEALVSVASLKGLIGSVVLSIQAVQLRSQ